MKRPVITVTVCLGLLALVFLLYQLKQQTEEVANLTTQLARITAEKNTALARLGKDSKEISALKQCIGAAAPAADEKFEDALAPWLAKVHSLSDFLGKHPEFRIPQLELLESTDWLDVTKGKLETEADYRKALGSLRGLAREHTSEAIADALKRAVAANGGQPPSDPTALLAYLPAGFDPAIVANLQVNPSGMIPGLRSIQGPPQSFYIIDKPVDIWDGTMFYGLNGIGSHSVGIDGERTVTAAITQFTQANGSAPRTPQQLLQYKGIDTLDPAALAEIFKALTTKLD